MTTYREVTKISLINDIISRYIEAAEDFFTDHKANEFQAAEINESLANALIALLKTACKPDKQYYVQVFENRYKFSMDVHGNPIYKLTKDKR